MFGLSLGGRVYVIDCNLGEKPCPAYPLKGKWKVIYDTARGKDAGGSKRPAAGRMLRGYEARIVEYLEKSGTEATGD